MTNLRLVITLNFGHERKSVAEKTGFNRVALQTDVKTESGWGIFVIRLKPVHVAYCVMNGERCEAYRRGGCSAIEVSGGDSSLGTPFVNVLVLEDEHMELVHTAQLRHDERWTAEDPFLLKSNKYQES
jgi:hypothetical protein